MNQMRLVPVTIDGRTFRLIFEGPRSNLAEASKALTRAAETAPSEDAFLADASAILAGFGCAIVETRDLTPPSVRPPLVDLLRFAAGRNTAPQSWALIKAVLLDANEDDLKKLISDGHLSFAQDLIHDVSRDLDEDCEAELAGLRDELPYPYDYILTGLTRG